ncbi:MAG: hypothetical protein U0359_30505 [Byssovorax sp.]
MKLGSLAAWTTVLTLAAGVASIGCIVEDGSGGTNPPPDTTPQLDDPREVSITPDKTLDSPPGEGVGMFVEYATGGHWHVYTTCDSLVTSNNDGSQVSCAFDAFFTVVDGSGKITNAVGENLEGKDAVTVAGDGTVHLFADTDTDTDGITFDTAPGAVIELEAYLDGNPEPRFIYWFGDTILHAGAPTDPVQFRPSAP